MTIHSLRDSRYLKESPRWLLTKGRQMEAWKILKDMAKENNTEVPDLENAGRKIEEVTILNISIFKSIDLILNLTCLFCRVWNLSVFCRILLFNP